MNTNVGRAVGVLDTPLSAMREYVVEHLSAIMTASGIESISIRKYESGLHSTTIATASPFKDAPKEIVSQGLLIKDAIAQIMATANTTKIALTLSDEEMQSVKSVWQKTLDALRNNDVQERQDAGETQTPQTEKAGEGK